MTQAERKKSSMNALNALLNYGDTLVIVNRKQIASSTQGNVAYYDFFKIEQAYDNNRERQQVSYWLTAHIANVLGLKYNTKHECIVIMWHDYQTIVNNLSAELFDGDRTGLKVLKL